TPIRRLGATWRAGSTGWCRSATPSTPIPPRARTTCPRTSRRRSPPFRSPSPSSTASWGSAPGRASISGSTAGARARAGCWCTWGNEEWRIQNGECRDSLFHHSDFFIRFLHGTVELLDQGVGGGALLLQALRDALGFAEDAQRVEAGQLLDFLVGPAGPAPPRGE